MSEWQVNTGVCPVKRGTLVDVEFADGYIVYHTPALTVDVDDEGIDKYGGVSCRAAFDWSIDGVGADIVQWRLHEEEERDE